MLAFLSTCKNRRSIKARIWDKTKEEGTTDSYAESTSYLFSWNKSVGLEYATVREEPLATQSSDAKDLGFVNPDLVSFTQWTVAGYIPAKKFHSICIQCVDSKSQWILDSLTFLFLQRADCMRNLVYIQWATWDDFAYKTQWVSIFWFLYPSFYSALNWNWTWTEISGETQSCNT